jgi:hypothetical protein
MDRNLPFANALELTIINVPKISLYTASVNVLLARLGIDAFEKRIIAVTKLMIPASMLKTPKIARAATKADFFTTG